MSHSLQDDVPAGDWFCPRCAWEAEDADDRWDETCHECGEDGDLVMCEGSCAFTEFKCQRSYHLECVPPKGLREVPSWKFFCPDCECHRADTKSKGKAAQTHTKHTHTHTHDLFFSLSLSHSDTLSFSHMRTHSLEGTD